MGERDEKKTVNSYWETENKKTELIDIAIEKDISMGKLMREITTYYLASVKKVKK